MAVYLRWKQLSDGRKSAYLDIYHNEKRQYEFLKIYILQKPDTPIEKQSNHDMVELAKRIRANRELELLGNENDVIPKFKKDADFLQYFKKYHDTYINKDIRLVKACLSHFIDFIKARKKNSISIKSINQQLCTDFKGYLQDKLHGETPANYFKKFKACVQMAVREKMISEDPTEGVSVVRSNGMKKEILNYDEIKALAGTPCGNEQVKKAFLLSLNTGLRWVDVKGLRWKNIDGTRLRFVQSKTQTTSTAAGLSIDLNRTAIALIGQRGEPDTPIFKLPSHTACNKDLKTWVKKAGIDKHITWHCGRHSIAVNLLDNGSDIKTVASILGHSGLAHVDKYLRIIDQRKKEAVNKLPDLEIK